jgi:hypothetical protein
MMGLFPKLGLVSMTCGAGFAAHILQRRQWFFRYFSRRLSLLRRGWLKRKIRQDADEEDTQKDNKKTTHVLELNVRDSGAISRRE